MSTANVKMPQHTISLFMNSVFDYVNIPATVLGGIMLFTGFGIEEIKHLGPLLGPLMIAVSIAINYFWHWKKKKAEHRLLLTKIKREEHITKLLEEGKITVDELKEKT